MSLYGLKGSFRGAFLTTSGCSSRGYWLLAALWLSSCAAAVSAAAAAKEFGAMVRKASAAPRTPSLQVTSAPYNLYPTSPPFSTGMLLPSPPTCEWTLPLFLPAAETLGLALGPRARVRPMVALPPTGLGEACSAPGCSFSLLLLGRGRREDDALYLQTL